MARKMKNSGIEWIGEIPAKWNVVRTKSCYTNKKQVVGENSEYYERLALTLNGVIKRPKDDTTGLQPGAFNGYQILKENELVFKLIDLENVSTSRVGYSPYTGIVSPAYIVLHPRNNNESIFGEYYFLSMWQREIFNHMGDDGVRSSLNAGDLLNIPYLAVPDDEKEEIVSFLDQKCAEIDAVIEKTKATIEEYKKLKQSVITEAITKGIRGNRPMKFSGNMWYGDIPVDWDIRKIKYMFRIKKDIAGKEGYTVLSITQKGIIPKNISNNEGQLADNYSKYQFATPGDFAMNHMDLLTGWVDVSKYNGVISPDYRVFVLCDTENNCKPYYLYLMQMCYFNKIFYGLGQGVSGMGRWRLQTDKFLNFTIPVPSFKEQQEISIYLDQKCAEIDTLIATKTDLLTELENYKKSLIYEYITGKKEVGEVSDTTTVAIVYPYFPAVLSTDRARFAQAVLMSKILDSNVKYMGRVKLEKMLFTIEHSIGFDFDTDYARQKAGPLDGSIYECEKIVSRTNKWFYVNKSQYGTSYKPQKNMGKYKRYYEQYFSDYNEEIEGIISVFENYSLQQSEIVATLFAAWNDAIIDNKPFTDEDVVNDVLNNWHESKTRFSKDMWLRAMDGMRKNNLVPKGYGKKTVIKN